MNEYTPEDVLSEYEWKITDAAAKRIADLINTAVKEAVDGFKQDAMRYRWLKEYDNTSLLSENIIDEAIRSRGWKE
ncbi:MAG: hypothetical protein BV459_05005 [Thermoplasmata archaeon M11B2D]|nr:MAG: hypothetical protein BV459_05005 [Thermoplasmata archaeon M11B2D]